jgi:hypothetical protein
MTSEISDAEDRTKHAWEHIFALVANDAPVPTGDGPSTDANPEELRASLITAAMALDELYETGTLQPDPKLRVLETMRNLLLVLDSVTPLPAGLVPPTDLIEVIEAIRAARQESSV